jgi:hypothetical protein
MAVIAASVALPCAAAAAQQEARQERLTFTRGASSATVRGRVRGYETVDYAVRAAAGQTLSVRLKPSNPANYFNVLSPGNADAAMYNGQTGEPYSGLLPTDGDYRVRVYLMRNEARRNQASTFTLTVGVTGKPLASLAAAQDALVAGTHYHATATVTCLPLPYGDTTPRQCDAGVIRRGIDGTVTVAIVLEPHSTRHILFVGGKPVAADSMQPMTAAREGDVTVVKFENGEYHRIPDALVFGG